MTGGIGSGGGRGGCGGCGGGGVIGAEDQFGLAAAGVAAKGGDFAGDEFFEAGDLTSEVEGEGESAGAHEGDGAGGAVADAGPEGAEIGAVAEGEFGFAGLGEGFVEEGLVEAAPGEVAGLPATEPPGGADGGDADADDPSAGGEGGVGPGEPGGDGGEGGGEDQGAEPLEAEAAVFASDFAADAGVEEEFAAALEEFGDEIVDAASGGALDFGEDLVARGIEVVEGDAAGVGIGGDGAGGEIAGADVGDVLGGDRLGEVPAEGAVGAGEVAEAGEAIDLVEDEDELVAESGEGLGEDEDGFGGGAGLVGVEEEEDEVGAFGEDADGGGEVVAAGVGGADGIDHAGAVHQCDGVEEVVGDGFESELGGESGAEMGEVVEAEVGMGGDGEAVGGGGLEAPGEDGEAVVGGGESGGLDLLAEEVVDEGGFAGGMVAEEEDDGGTRRGGEAAIVFEGQPFSQGLEDALVKFRGALREVAHTGSLGGDAKVVGRSWQ